MLLQNPKGLDGSINCIQRTRRLRFVWTLNVYRRRVADASRRVRAFILLVLCAISLVASADQSSTNRSDVCVFISSVRGSHPIISIQRGDFPPDHDFVVFDPQTSRRWRTNYTLFSQALVESAKKEHLDASSLAKVLKNLRFAPVNKNDAILPVAARSTIRDGEPVWVVTLRWEIAKWVADGAKLAHIEEFTVIQKALKQVDFSTCG